MKKISVKEFIKKYEALKSEELKNDYVNSIVKNNYVPYENKVTICQKIVEASYYIIVKDRDGKERKKMHINSTAKHMLYCLNVVNNYTNLEINFKNSLEEFNALNKIGCLDLILENVPEKEIKELKMIFEMVESDLIKNEYEPHAFISNQVERFGDLAGATLSPLLKMLIEQFDSFDDQKIEMILDAANKFTSK